MFESAVTADESGLVAGTARATESSGRKSVSRQMAANMPVSDTRSEAQTDYFKQAKGKDKTVTTAMGGADMNGRMIAPIKVRKNFSETAFFYPHLETNEEGEVIIKFTVPEALTKWKMLGFAHTKDLKFGLIDNELVTQKDLMVMPNVPRFLRENDKMTLTAKVSNISKKDLAGKARLYLFDALTMDPVDTEFNSKNAIKSFSVKAGQSTNLTWAIKVPEGIQAVKYWLNKGRYMQGMIALGLYRYDNEEAPVDIIMSLKEHAQISEEMGMYWKDNSGGYYWYQAPIETHSLLIEAFDEILKDQKVGDDLRVWLLKNKQTNDWRTTKATTEAVYALLRRGTDWLATESGIEILVGNIKIDPKEMPDVKAEAGTGYFKTSWSGSEIKPSMGNIKVTKKDEGVSWGALYWQYFEQLDKITPHETPLKLKKQLFKQVQTGSGKVIKPIGKETILETGDKVIVRIELRVDRDMEYVHMKDMRAACFEPLNVISRYKYQDGLGYYESTRDVSTNFFFSHLTKGTYVFEYPLWVTHKGDFSNGITTIQCMYAPEFASHSEGIRIRVK